MDIPVRVSINRKSPGGKNANGPYRDGKEFDCSTGGLPVSQTGSPQGSPPLREPILLIHFHSGLVFSLYRLLLHNLQSLVYF